MSDKIVDTLDVMEEYGRRWKWQKDLNSRYVPPLTADKMRVKGASSERASKQKVSALQEAQCAVTSAAANSETQQNGKRSKQSAKQTKQLKTAPAESHKQSQTNAQSSASTYEFGELLAQGNPTPASATNATRLYIPGGNAHSTLVIYARRKGILRKIAQVNQRVTEPMVPVAEFASCAVSPVQ